MRVAPVLIGVLQEWSDGVQDFYFFPDPPEFHLFVVQDLVDVAHVFLVTDRLMGH